MDTHWRVEGATSRVTRKRLAGCPRGEHSMCRGTEACVLLGLMWGRRSELVRGCRWEAKERRTEKKPEWPQKGLSIPAEELELYSNVSGSRKGLDLQQATATLCGVVSQVNTYASFLPGSATFGIDSVFNAPSRLDFPDLIQITRSPNCLPGNRRISPHTTLYPHEHPPHFWTGALRRRSV